MYVLAAKHKGSISAEHGLGFKKSQYIYHSKSKEAVEVMKDLKHLFDPKVSCATNIILYFYVVSFIRVFSIHTKLFLALLKSYKIYVYVLCAPYTSVQIVLETVTYYTYT